MEALSTERHSSIRSVIKTLRRHIFSAIDEKPEWGNNYTFY